MTKDRTPPQPCVQPSIRSFFQPQPQAQAQAKSPPALKSPSIGTSRVETLPPSQAHKNTMTAFPVPPPPKATSPQYNLPSAIPPAAQLPQPQSGSDIPPLYLPRNSSIPPQAQIIVPSEPHISSLRRINSLLLPISYPDSFYTKILSPPTPSTPCFTRVVTWTDSSLSTVEKVIGGIVCRIDAMPPSSSAPPSYEIYVQSLAVLSAHREKGLATALLNNIISAAASSSEVRIDGLYAHVWTENKEALEWYQHRGFVKDTQVVQGYYMKLKPSSAWVLRRKLAPTDLLSALPSPALQVSRTLGVMEPAQQRPGMPQHTASFQDRRPDREWNDLPEDMGGGALLRTKGQGGSAESSRSSSRSGLGESGREKGKKKRLYPAAAFGGP